jgi:superfamily II DNA or RNA helicase
LGVTATADRGDKKNLGQYLQGCLVEYGILEAVRDGYLVRPIAKTLPLKIDLKGVKMRGHDLDAAQVSERLNPLLK